MAEARRIVARLLAEGDFRSPGFLISLGKRGVIIPLSIPLSLCYIDRLRSVQDRERQMEGVVDC